MQMVGREERVSVRMGKGRLEPSGSADNRRRRRRSASRWLTMWLVLLRGMCSLR